jgi:putative membrane protein insertion efficiency factor
MSAVHAHTAPGRPPVHVSDPDPDRDDGPAVARKASPIGALLIGAIRLYQLARIGRVSPCRFTPTCSQFAVEAVQRHGARRGLVLAARRLGRCRPRGPSGYDPVPE